jgi:hypothetical protein
VSTSLRAHLACAIPGLLVVGLMVLWGEHDGGYFGTTWYWGALVVLALLGASASLGHLRRPTRPVKIALLAFGAYVIWSYASMLWAQDPGLALEGSNRALLYLLLFALFALLPWTTPTALAALLVFAAGIGAIAILVLFRFAAGSDLPAMILGGRLIAPTGYFNSSVALFTMGALVAVALAARRELPWYLRGLLLAMAAGDLQLALIGQSRGWLITLPLVLIVGLVLVRERLRITVAAVIPTVAMLIPLHALLAILPLTIGGTFTPAAQRACEHAGRIGLVCCFGALVVGGVLAQLDAGLRPAPLAPRVRRGLGTLLVLIAVAAGLGGAAAATHGHPIAFLRRQINGFAHEETGGQSSHYATVGSARYDVWRVSLDAFLAHPIGGIGQDNFADYYILRRRSPEDPSWPHSLELRLLAMTGIVGFLLVVGFLGAALAATAGTLRNHRSSRPDARERELRDASGDGRLRVALIAIALLPLVDWLIHGSVDWFWEMPALSAPALGFLGMATALAAPARRGAAGGTRLPGGTAPRGNAGRVAARSLAAAALLAATLVLALPYLSEQEAANADRLRSSDAVAALADLKLSHELNPLSAAPGQLGGTIALQAGLYEQAQARYHQATSAEPGGWLAWFGEGLASGQLGERSAAMRQLRRALEIEDLQPAIRLALQRERSGTPLPPDQALAMLLPNT